MERSYAFALEIYQLAKYLRYAKKEYIFADQILRSGTAIGALIKEAEHAQSKADFLNKMNIALKEANETDYWLMLIHESELIDTNTFETLRSKNIEILKLLISIVKSTKKGLGRIS